MKKNVLSVCAIVATSLFFVQTSFAQGGQKWSVSGNSTGQNDFIGTTNSNDLIFKANSTEGFRLTPNGDIGVGTPSPTARLDLSGTFRLNDGTQQTGYFLGTDANGNASWQALPAAPPSIWQQVANNAFYLAGNVGIGTDTPSTGLHIEGTHPQGGGTGLLYVKSTDKAFLTLEGTGDHSGIILKKSGATKWIMRNWTETADDFILHGDNLNKKYFFIDQGTGFTGINTITPSSRLTVAGTIESTSGGVKFPDGSVQSTAAASIGSNFTFHDLDVDGRLKVGSNSMILGVFSGTGADENHIYVEESAIQPMDIYIQSTRNNVSNPPTTSQFNHTILNANDNTGYVGIGTVNPRAKVDINIKDQGTVEAGLRIDKPFVSLPQNSVNADLIQGRVEDGSNTYSNVFKVDGQGRVGIQTGTNNLLSKLQIDEGFHMVYNNSDAVITHNAYKGASSQWQRSRAGSNPAQQIAMTSGGDIFIRTADYGQKNSIITWNNGIFVRNNGQVGIGNCSPLDMDGPSGALDYKLFVEQGIITEKLKVAIKGTANWADYVFDEGYELKPLSEVEQFVKENHHLPNVPSAETVVESGIDVAKMDAVLLQKIEELTLYVIELEKKVNELEAVKK